MCKYCKKLNQIKDLREKELNDCINKWKRRDLLARELILFMYANLAPDFDSVFEEQVFNFMDTNWIGK